MVQLPDRVRSILEKIVRRLSRRETVSGVGLFGSWSRGEAVMSSDVDLLIVDNEDFDYEFVESLFLAIHDGHSLKDAFSWLAGECETMLENELKYAQSEENFLEMAVANDWYFFESGKRA